MSNITTKLKNTHPLIKVFIGLFLFFLITKQFQK